MKVKNFKDFEGKALIQYYREKAVEVIIENDKTGELELTLCKGAPRGVMMALENGIIGWSLCNKLDTFNREKGLDIAYRRALKSMEDPEYDLKVPQSLQNLAEEMLCRSSIYYK